MKLHNDFAQRLGVEHAIIQAPMAGGATTPELVAAVSNAGALGSFAAAILPPQSIAGETAKVRALTQKPFNVNVFILDAPTPSQHELAQAMEWLRPIREELGLEPATAPQKFCENSREQIRALIEAAPPVVSSTFGVLDAETVSRFHDKGCLVIGTATNVAEGKAWQDAGADFVCAQGAEAGAHRGTFIGDPQRSMIGLVALIPQMADALDVPVIAAGGIMNGRGIAAALILGASAVQLGTAFLTCPEAGIPSAWKERLRRARDDETVVTRAFTGKHARALANEFIERMKDRDVPTYPVQNALTAEIRQAAAKQARMQYFSLWAGQGAPMSRSLPAAELVRTLVEETRRVLA